MNNEQTIPEGPICFVIMKFGKKDTPEYKLHRSIYDDILRPAVEESGLGYKCVRADDIMRPRSIIKDIVELIWKADIVIADLSDQNPNVFYELGVRHALKGRTIMLVQSMEEVPFDVRNYRIIEYSPNSPSGFRQVTVAIRNHLQELYNDPQASDSPVLDVLSSIVHPLVAEEGGTCDANISREIKMMKSNMEGLMRRFDTEVAAKLEMVTDVAETQKNNVEKINQIFSQLRPNLLNELFTNLDKIGHRVEELSQSEMLTTLIDKFGLNGIHRTRPDAIEKAFYPLMDSETKQIDIVGSTIFGLRGSSWVNTARILDLFKNKKLTEEKFVIRILLTHYEFLSTRMDQERNVKTPDRYVISREAVSAIEELRKRDLLDNVRFYKGAPTCFTIVCHQQKQMLLNPYPYEREAYSSWSIIFSDVPTGVYQDFLISHVENPWENSLLTEPYSDGYEKALRERADKDLEQYIAETKSRPR